MWTCLRGQQRRDLERLWFENYHSVDERIPRLRGLPFNRLLHVTEVYTEEELRTSEAYNALRTFARAGNAVDIRLNGLNGSRILWQVNDPVGGEAWSSGQLERIGLLLPHIRQTVHVLQTLAGANALGAALTELLDADVLGIVQLDARGQIVAANDHARDLLREGDGLFDKHGVLFARSSQDNDRLQDLLGRALPQVGAQGAGGSMTVRRPGALPPLVLRVQPTGWQKADDLAWPVAVLVLLVDPANGAAIDPAVVAEALDFTRMESRVAVLLAQGMSVSRIATVMDRKESTIRTHVKHMFAKHGLNRQAELMRLVQSLGSARDLRG